jgi:hypothetical protein
MPSATRTEPGSTAPLAATAWGGTGAGAPGTRGGIDDRPDGPTTGAGGAMGAAGKGASGDMVSGPMGTGPGPSVATGTIGPGAVGGAAPGRAGRIGGRVVPPPVASAAIDPGAAVGSAPPAGWWVGAGPVKGSVDWSVDGLAGSVSKVRAATIGGRGGGRPGFDRGLVFVLGADRDHRTGQRLGAERGRHRRGRAFRRGLVGDAGGGFGGARSREVGRQERPGFPKGGPVGWARVGWGRVVGRDRPTGDGRGRPGGRSWEAAGPQPPPVVPREGAQSVAAEGQPAAGASAPWACGSSA